MGRDVEPVDSKTARSGRHRVPPPGCSKLALVGGAVDSKVGFLAPLRTRTGGPPAPHWRSSMTTRDVHRKLQSRIASLPAKSHPVSLDTASCAVIGIDTQNDFETEGGMLHRAGFDISMIRSVVEPTRKALVAAGEIGIPVICLKMAFTPDLFDAGPADCSNDARHQFLGGGGRADTGWS